MFCFLSQVSCHWLAQAIMGAANLQSFRLIPCWQARPFSVTEKELTVKVLSQTALQQQPISCRDPKLHKSESHTRVARTKATRSPVRRLQQVMWGRKQTCGRSCGQRRPKCKVMSDVMFRNKTRSPNIVASESQNNRGRNSYPSIICRKVSETGI